MLSLERRKDARPIAIIKGGRYNNKIVYIHDEKQKAIFKSQHKKGDPLVVTDGVFEILPTEKTRVSFTGAPSGAGKSTLCANYVKYYKQLYPRAPFILFSQKNKDKVLDVLKPHRIIVDESIVEDPIEVEDIPNNAIVVFDDIDHIMDKKIQNAVNTLKAQCMEIGRARGIHVYIIQHLINGNERKLTRSTMNEMQSWSFFPNAGSTRPIEYCLQQYFGLDKTKIKKILDLNSRWCCLLKEYPQVLISENFIIMLKDL